MLSPLAAKLAVNTAKTLGADICGVDILEGPLGPVVIEANISPGLQGLSAVSTIDIADEIAKHLFHKTEEIVTGIKKRATVEVMKEIEKPSTSQEVISSLTFRGQRILLPEFAARMAGFSDDKEYTIKAKKGKLEIEEFTL